MKLYLYILMTLSSCFGEKAISKSIEAEKEYVIHGDTVDQLGNNIMVVYQNQQNTYWFGSWETGLYRYDGQSLINFTTQHGLASNRIDEIKEDKSGNLYFSSGYPTPSVTKYDGKTFTTLTAESSDNWNVNSEDLWFRYSYENENKVFRYDGEKLHVLALPQPSGHTAPFGVYTIYKDMLGNVWFGTNPVGVCRYDGKSFDWITEEDVTEYRDQGANGVRSITEDKNGDFWFNTEYHYRITETISQSDKPFYTRIKSIGSLDGKKDSNLNEYLSTVRANGDNLWFVTYRDGVWKYDGKISRQCKVHENTRDITLFSIYKDNEGNLWLGTHEHGAYKWNGEKFEKFKLSE